MHHISIVYIYFNNMIPHLYDEGEYFKIHLKRRNYMIGHDAVEGFVNPKHAFMIEIEQGAGPSQMFVTDSNLHYCYTCGVIYYLFLVSHFY